MGTLAAAWKLIGVRGAIGIGVALMLSFLLVVQKGETRHWTKQSNQFEQLYRQQQQALTTTELNYRRAADQARAADATNAARVQAQQASINQETTDDFQKRIADARGRADRLQQELASAAAHSGNGGAAPVPGVPAPAAGAAQAAGQDRLPAGDALTATEQAIQLDELIKWVKRQAAVDVKGSATP